MKTSVPVDRFCSFPAMRTITAVIAVFVGVTTPGAHAATFDWVTVGDAGNAPDTTGYGAVGYEYRIGRYEVTIQQYTDFLNAVAQSDPYSLWNASNASDLNIAGISRSGTSGEYTYSVINNDGPSGNRPITYLSWFDAARFANWMHNGQGSGSTETGAYTLNGATSGDAPARNEGAQFYIPTENEWYKAAYYSPVKGGPGSPGYYTYATESDTAPGNMIGSGANQANYYTEAGFSVTQSTNLSSVQNYLTDVGAFSNSDSYYGTFDQNGNVWEWNDYTGASGATRGLRGGNWFGGASNLLSSSGGLGFEPGQKVDGFRLASPVPEPSTWVMGAVGIACAGWGARRRRNRKTILALLANVSVALIAACHCTAPAHAATFDWVTVGDAGNANDTTGYGAVSYEYRIGKYEVTIQQYTDFLNAVAQSDPYSLWNASNASDLNIAGISRSGESGSYTYSVIGPSGITPTGASSPGHRPVTHVSWFDAARFANWMQNGQGAGSTETGAYTLNGATSGDAPARNGGAMFYIPTESEWYKAAYYRSGGTNAGYWDYATQSDSLPDNEIGSGVNQANYRENSTNSFSVTQSVVYSPIQNYLTDMGAFTSSASAYNTFDQNGNVWEWNDLAGTAGATRGVRGGGWDYDNEVGLSSSFRLTYNPAYENVSLGFRIVPEPSTWVMGAVGIACAGWGAFRRRNRP